MHPLHKDRNVGCLSVGFTPDDSRTTSGTAWLVPDRTEFTLCASCVQFLQNVVHRKQRMSPKTGHNTRCTQVLTLCPWFYPLTCRRTARRIQCEPAFHNNFHLPPILFCPKKSAHKTHGY